MHYDLLFDSEEEAMRRPMHVFQTVPWRGRETETTSPDRTTLTADELDALAPLSEDEWTSVSGRTKGTSLEAERAMQRRIEAAHRLKYG